MLYLSEPVDEYVMQHLADFDGHKMQSLTKEGVKFGDEDEDVTKRRTKLYKKNFKPLTEYLKTLYDGKVNKVTVSQRVETTPSVIVTSMYGQSANMERIMKAQALRDSSSSAYMMSKKTMEVNPHNPIIKSLRDKVAADQGDKTVKDVIWMLYDTSLLTSGFSLDEPVTFANRIHRLIKLGLSIDEDDEEEEADEGMPGLESSEEIDSTMEEVD